MRRPLAALLTDALHGVQTRSRRRKLDQLLALLAPGPATTLLDVGVGNTEPLPSTNYLERHYPYRERITALGVGELAGFRQLHPDIRAVGFDGGRFPFADGEFDIAHSNAVIEHVGSREQQREFLAEMVRVARAGMVTTPDRAFPVETHTLLPFVHWLGKERFDRAVAVIGVHRIETVHGFFGRGFPARELADLRLLDAADLGALADEVGLGRRRIVRNRLLGWPMTLTLVWWRI
jgi:hypothetical protein